MRLSCKYFKIRKFEKKIVRLYVFVCLCVFLSIYEVLILLNLSFLMIILENIRGAWFFFNEYELLTNK